MKFSTKTMVNDKEKMDGVLVGRVVNEPKLLTGRPDKQDVAYFRVANNLPQTSVFYDVTVIGDAVKRVEKLEKGGVVALKGEFGTKESDGKTVETIIANTVEVF
ncbi:single-stranded DNA-binding protein (plasmid) [Aneurinibacillus sp. Ricciae_BoGa-3]|uniref:single-stranded DNA-binding protein n=1 Tax=Aneurinibacillus sp. Ricciae_BoGa-3 TaxID=3022697 RepID=UPI002341CCD5|nr:single-stranded DNA-binding protein [Aneurinibacillus sp. Ricciae_BoGa-3]WCK57197.1 single-stranded DNA-binding protein [Aneurinibacillus sp. Ricciae_BoGa-3]